MVDKIPLDALEASGVANEAMKMNAAADAVEFSGDARLPRAYLAGLGLSNDADSDHDIAIAAGEARDAANSMSMVLAAILTKQIDATWAAGDDAGGMNDGDAVGASEWFHVFLLSSADGATIDAGFDTSLTAAGLLADTAVIAAGLTKYRRIGSVLTDGSSNIIAFSQLGDEFLWADPPLDYDTSSLGTTAATPALSVPLGLKIHAIYNAMLSGGNDRQAYISSPDQNDEAASLTAAPLASAVRAANNEDAVSPGRTRTDTSARVRVVATASSTTLRIATLGWIDRRGRDD